ncbi:MAG: N-acetyltransferase family protein [Nitrososphaeria archaeon]
MVEARPEDWQAVGRFFREAWRLAGPGALGWIGASDQVVAEMTTREALLEMLTRPNTRTFIAKDRQMVVGLASIKKIDGQTAELSGIVVRQDLIAHRIGSRLLDKARSTAVADGFKSMTVNTEPNNERAIRFYTSKGFQTAEETDQEVLGKKVKLLRLILDLKKS